MGLDRESEGEEEACEILHDQIVEKGNMTIEVHIHTGMISFYTWRECSMTICRGHGILATTQP